MPLRHPLLQLRCCELQVAVRGVERLFGSKPQHSWLTMKTSDNSRGIRVAALAPWEIPVLR